MHADVKVGIYLSASTGHTGLIDYPDAKGGYNIS